MLGGMLWSSHMVRRALLGAFLVQLLYGGCQDPEVAEVQAEAPAPEMAPMGSEPLKPPVVEAGERQVVPSIAKQFQLSEFKEANEERLLALHITMNWKRSDEIRANITDLLSSRVPSPYHLVPRDELGSKQSWGRVVVNHRGRVEKLKKRRKKLPRPGRLHFKVDIAMRLPRRFVSNWSDFSYALELERNYDKLKNMDNDLWHMLDDALPSLTIQDKKATSRFLERMQLRDDLSAGVLHPVLSEPIDGTHRGGCVTTRRGEDDIALYRMREPTNPVALMRDRGWREVRCTRKGAFIAEASTDRSANLRYIPWSQGEEGWLGHASFDSEIEPSTLRFLASGNTLCLLGENRKPGVRHAKLVCVDARTGKQRWTWDASGTDLQGAAVHEGTLVVAAGKYLALLDMRNGEELWRSKVDGATGLRGDSQSCLFDGVFLFAYDIGRYLAFDVESQLAPWSLVSFGSGFMRCDGAGNMYYDEVGGNLLSVDLESLAPQWRFRLPGPVQDALFHGNHLFLLRPRALYAIDTERGELAWQLPLNAPAKRLYRHDRRLYLIGEQAMWELTRPDRI